MTERFITINGLEVALLALLPKDGTRVTVAELMHATGEDRDAVTAAFFYAHSEGKAGFDGLSDSYFSIPQGNDLNKDLSTERKST